MWRNNYKTISAASKEDFDAQCNELARQGWNWNTSLIILPDIEGEPKHFIQQWHKGEEIPDAEGAVIKSEPVKA